MYNIRKASKNDETILISLSRKTINHNFRLFMGDDAVDSFINSGMADKEITDWIGEILILELDKKIIGLCIWKESLLHLIMIDPEFQGTGAASYFIENICEDRLKKYKEIYLESFENNERANSFYQKCGWEMYKKETDAEMGWNRLFYRKS